MAHELWGALDPATVSEAINFDRSKPDWLYQPGDCSIAARQAEGVAYLWNTLALNNAAILADEVGMGKTFQALGIMSFLWKAKPDAKVLVMAPNRDICAHWVREYHSFLAHHYRESDHLVRNAADGGPIHAARICHRLYDLVEAVQAAAGNFYLTTIHSLSGLVLDKSLVHADKLEHAGREARSAKAEIKAAIGESGFDLIIVDEAHYLRNAGGGSQRVRAARNFFGKGSDRLGQKYLLITATPCHSNVGDVGNILSYFVDAEGDEDVASLLDRYALRRFRLMKGLDDRYHNKHSYRNEHAMGASFEENPASELFFALYQRRLARDKERVSGGRRYLYGYLEGFESVGSDEALQSTSSGRDDDDDAVQESFRKAPDTEILQELTGKYHKLFGEFPKHPKYGVLVDELVPDDVLDPKQPLDRSKHLVFVRRIPSVRELTQRVNAAYDNHFAALILDAWGIAADDPRAVQWKESRWSRPEFVQLIAGKTLADDVVEQLSEDEESADEDTQDNRLGSRIADLFVVKKEGILRTDCSNVSLRFRRPDSIFSMFLEPASDYRIAGYSHYEKHGVRAEYSSAAKHQRLHSFDLITDRTENIQYGVVRQRYNKEVTTAWGLIYKLLTADERQIIEDWLKQDKGIVENFANYLQAGFLFASPVMVELYCWFTRFNREYSSHDTGAEARYHAFISWVEEKLPDSLLFSYFRSALATFQPLCEKIVDHKLNEWQKDWRSLGSLHSPAWYASGETANRQRLILGFNSPFYPNVLVATSVFQEGVNLHMQCAKVHHYGIAWTPGDNEQRVGRIDRLFGKVNEKLMQDSSATLDIHFPYLKNSFDEDQLTSFLKNKLAVEQKLDAGIYTQFDQAIDIESAAGDLHSFLRKGDLQEYSDPFPARFDEARRPRQPYQSKVFTSEFGVFEHLKSLFAEFVDASSNQIFDVKENSANRAATLLIDAKVEGASGRRQPVLVERHFSSEFSSLVEGTVYYVTLRTPIASAQVLADEGVSLERAMDMYLETRRDYPLAKLALDEEASLSQFYLSMKCELPLFVRSSSTGLLSPEELRQAFVQVKRAADGLELALFGRDLQASSLKIYEHLAPTTLERGDLLPQHESAAIKHPWETTLSAQGEVASLSGTVDTQNVLRRWDWDRKSTLTAAQCLALNHNIPFLQVSDVIDGRAHVALCYPAVDFQREEQELLEKWFEYATGVVL